MQRWTNEKFKSNVHRVINKSGKERYSIPVFVSGNPDYVVECIPSDEPAKYEPITVQEAVSAAYAESYGRAQKYKQGLQQAIDSKVQTQAIAV